MTDEERQAQDLVKIIDMAGRFGRMLEEQDFDTGMAMTTAAGVLSAALDIVADENGMEAAVKTAEILHENLLKSLRTRNGPRLVDLDFGRIH